MRRQLVHWRHEIDEEPVLLYSEVDGCGRELRKVEGYRSGRLDVAGDGIETGSTRLSEARLPAIEEIDALDEFSAEEISGDDFEVVWRRALEWFEIYELATASAERCLTLRSQRMQRRALGPGQWGYFDLPAGSQSVVHLPDGTTVQATRFWVRNNGTGTWHGYPMP